MVVNKNVQLQCIGNSVSDNRGQNQPCRVYLYLATCTINTSLNTLRKLVGRVIARSVYSGLQLAVFVFHISSNVFACCNPGSEERLKPSVSHN